MQRFLEAYVNQREERIREGDQLDFYQHLKVLDMEGKWTFHIRDGKVLIAEGQWPHPGALVRVV